MKKTVVVLILLVLLLTAFSSVAYADAHYKGLPGAHELTGREFGEAVANSVKECPFDLVQHVGGRAPFECGD